MSATDLPSIRLQPWVTAPATQKVMAALGGEAGEVRFVGGCVRNALLGEDEADVDLATVHAPDKVISLLEAADIKAVPTGIEHGTVTAVADGTPFEVTTLRRDVTTDGRHAEVAFTDDWQADARRRDFTVNALYADVQGQVFDFVSGLDDLRARRVRFIGNADDRIKEDYLRILRFFRMHAWYGKGGLDADGLAAASALKAGLQRLSVERVRDEMIKLFSASDPVPTLRVMAASGILADVLPEQTDIERFERVVEIESSQLFFADGLRRFGALMQLDEPGMAALAARWKMSHADTERLCAMTDQVTKIVCYLSIREVRRLLYKLDVDVFKDLVVLRWAADPKASNGVQWRALLAMADSWERPTFPLSGREVMAAGVPEGPEVGRVMDEVEEWWIDSDFLEDRFSIIERLKAVVQATVY